MSERTCLRCDVPTELGYIPDNTHGGIVSSAWVAGVAKPHWLGGIKRRPGLTLVAYRCPQCGGVELVAPARQQPSRGGH